MNKAKLNAIKGREDISRFVVHLTRDDTSDFENGDSAKENFNTIITERRIAAFRPHCLYANRIPENLWKKYSVACFTEVPLTQLHMLTKDIPGRSIRMQPFGIVFSREFIISKGAQPALYINTYQSQNWLKEAADKIFEIAKKNAFKKGKLWRILPFLNAMNEKYDFTWEREWRVRGDVTFTPKDVICVILPEDGEKSLKENFAENGIPVISPNLSFEEIIGELSVQQRLTRKIWVGKKKKAQRLKRIKKK
jgi:hypothetical protein